MNITEPKISIIVPVYKVESYLQTCVESILNQTFKDFELILVDDGSPDNCPQICDNLSKLDLRIRVIHKLNGGVASARNEAIKIAKGKYIMFCDSDDIVDCQWCELLIAAIEKFPNKWIVSNFWKGDFQNNYKKQVTTILDNEDLSYFNIYKTGLSPYLWNKIYSRKIIIDNKILFNEEQRFASDVEFNVKYFTYCKGCYFIQKPLYYYRFNINSITNTQKTDWMKKHLPLFYVRCAVINQDQLSEYCDIWLYRFIDMFNSVFNEKNKPFLQKLKYNQDMINSKEFRFCLEHASGKNESPILLKILNMHNYYVFYLFQNLMKLKNKVKGC